MLKWTVANKREASTETTAPVAAPVRRTSTDRTIQRRSVDGLRDRKQRRKSARRTSLCLRPGKENRFSTTPNNKLDVLTSTDGKALRDVSNITPKNNTAPRRLSSGKPRRKSIYTDDNIETNPSVKPLIRQRKKQCLNPSHAKNLLNVQDVNCGQSCSCCENNSQQDEVAIVQKPLPFASTLPSFQMEYSPCSLRNTQTSTISTNFRTTLPYRNLPYMKYVDETNSEEHCPQKKRAKIDHVSDFLHQISFITSPEDVRIRNVKCAAGLDNEHKDVTVSPLLRKFVDLQFSQISYAKEGKVHPVTDNVDDSAAFNDMSLDKIIDAILDTTAGSERLELRNSSNNNLQNENEQNEIHEENLINIVQEKQLTYTPENSVYMDEKDLVEKSPRDLTPELSVDDDINKRKRSLASLCDERNDSKRRNMDIVECDTDSSFALKRQKCVRRRRPVTFINNNICTEDMECDKMTNTPISAYNKQNDNGYPTEIESSPSYKAGLNDNSFSSSCLFEKSCTVTKSQNLDQSSMLSQQLDCLGYSPWRKENCCGLSTPSLQYFGKDAVFKGKRPLKRSVSDADAVKPMSGAASSTPTRRDRDLSANGYIDLRMSYNNGVLSVHGNYLFYYLLTPYYVVILSLCFVIEPVLL